MNFLAVSIREDVLLVLDMLEEMKNELLLERMDMIQLYRGGLDVLRIVLKNNNTGRSAYLEINDYKRRLSFIFFGARKWFNNPSTLIG